MLLWLLLKISNQKVEDFRGSSSIAQDSHQCENARLSKSSMEILILFRSTNADLNFLVKTLSERLDFSTGSERHFTLNLVKCWGVKQQFSMLTHPTQNKSPGGGQEGPDEEWMTVRWLSWNIYHFSIYGSSGFPYVIIVVCQKVPGFPRILTT